MIRVRKRKDGSECLQVIAVRYDGTVRRNRQRVIARLCMDTEFLPPDVEAQLTATEVRNAADFFAARRQERRQRAVMDSVVALVVHAHHVCNALAAPDLRSVVLRAANLYGLSPAMTRLARAAAVAGLHGRIKAPSRRL